MLELIQYVRRGGSQLLSVKDPAGEVVARKRGKKRPVGTLVATLTGEVGDVIIGWSKCHRRDNFSRATGLAIARLRIEKRYAPPGHMPSVIEKAVLAFVERCKKFYKVNADQIKVRGIRKHVHLTTPGAHTIRSAPPAGTDN